jgi:hypothetical protein
MIRPWRLLAAAALTGTLGSGIAAAQTIVVRHAPPAETIEAVLNSTNVARAEVTAAGDGTLPLKLSAINKTEIDANIFVDVCDKLHRITVVERTRLPEPPQPGCARRDVPGVYWVRPVNTVVVDVSGPTPSVLLIKGEYSVAAPRNWTASPAGLVVFGGGSYDSTRDAVGIFCGSAASCDSKGAGFGYTAGIAYWITPWLGAEAAYLKPPKITAKGGGDTYTFNSSLDLQVGTVAAKLAAPIGPLRLYGLVGGNYHESKSVTSETIAGASQNFEMKTDGWNWLFGGGAELWVVPSFALYGELSVAPLKGEDQAGGPARLDDRLLFISFGGRVHLGLGR